ncbi:cation:proton antiporter domain-containing protein [Alteraurantiacibacter buctensis]|uniref:Sodium:proton exchanger n=1 Tax=Alteraurantiacibacter buctensis TaxID=1503981 RepID=A0A844Z2J5_9SPHN|nr:cation:proton antiporter [Alteraurantiacibacter buctensis]MXO73370.1 sodium:proton exchanger [Alteraurantiacibacter buctensis]
MEEHGGALMLRDGLLMLGFALGFVLLFRRLGLGATLGYLLAGVTIGPEVLGLVGGAEQKVAFAELGIVMLLFIVGLELNPARLWSMRKEIFVLGGAQVVACGLAISATILALSGFTTEAALAIGLPLALSSTAQVLPMLQSAGRLKTPFGERAFAILLFQDLSIIPLITIVSAMSRNPDDAGGPTGWMMALMTLAAIAGLIAAGRFLIRPLFRLIARLGEREMFVVSALFTVVASAAIMQMLGLSLALGAFIAGVMLADTPYRHELEAAVEPFRSILLGLFFLAVGMMLDLSAIAQRPLEVAGFAVLLIATKTALITLLGRAMKMTWRGAVALGLLLSQGGEFAFVLYTAAQNALLITDEAASVFGAVVTVSMATTPFLMKLTRGLRSDPEGDDKPAGVGERPAPRDLSASALVIGHGRFGQTVARTLGMAGLTVTLVDRDVERIDISGEFGTKVYFGDGVRLDLLRQAGAADAQLIMFCIDGDQIEPDYMAAVQEAFPQAAIYVRGYDRRSVMKLGRAPQRYVIREVHESAIRMALLGLDALGLSEADIDRAEESYRREDRTRLRRQIDTGELRAAHFRMADPDGSGRTPVA